MEMIVHSLENEGKGFIGTIGLVQSIIRKKRQVQSRCAFQEYVVHNSPRMTSI